MFGFAQLVPQLIINYKLKVCGPIRGGWRPTDVPPQTERGAHAHEGDDLQDALDRRGRLLRVRALELAACQLADDARQHNSFCIKMPFLHRLACFRDDVVFLIFLYQVGLLPLPSADIRALGADGAACTALDIPHRPEACERVRAGARDGCG